MTLEHQKDRYRDDARLMITFCKVCGKEGLKLIQEPNCPGVFVDLTKPETETKKETSSSNPVNLSTK